VVAVVESGGWRWYGIDRAFPIFMEWMPLRDPWPWVWYTFP
jgi:hypothetical protein